MSTITRERLLTIQQWRETYGPGSNVVLPAEEAEELACIALERMDAKAVAWTDTDELRDVKNGGNGYLFAIGGEANKFADPRRQVMLYTTPPAQMLEIENLEHFISFWKKVQAGQMKPGKNDIDHMVWFLEGLSNLTTPPAPVAVPDDVMAAIQKVARIRLDLNDFDGDKRGILDCLSEAEEALIEVVNRRAAMLAAAPQQEETAKPKK
ncbi:hypothetical protein [Enterobacter kobei]|uniref:hypothetical protein n=1 Tax=Enterobacter kobei TaxID=208224 RepID=UPI00292DD66B|nr:hypothetical protein [Enterobacter kobei]